MNYKLPKQEPPLGRNVRGKKTRNPGYDPGNHWITCDRCGCVLRAFDAKKEWTGLWLCPDDWEQRHPQDFVRGRYDEIAASEPVRPDLPDQFVERDPLCSEIAVAGEAIAGCAVAGTGKDNDTQIPEGTFDNSL